MNFQHYLITRFNIPASNWKCDKNNKVVQDEVWLQKRISLFETFCLPSVIGQSQKNFQWLVWFDTNSPQLLKDKINEWQNKCTNFIPCYSVDYDEWQFSQMSIYIKENSKQEYVITTRLDNDDALRYDAIEQIQEAFVQQDNTIIDMPNGFCYNQQNHLFSRNTITSSPFISYIECFSKEHIDTVYREGHPAWIGKACFVNLQDFLWIQVIHDSNIANSQHGKICFWEQNSLFNTDIAVLSRVSVLHSRVKQEYYLLKHILKMQLLRLLGKNK